MAGSTRGTNPSANELDFSNVIVRSFLFNAPTGAPSRTLRDPAECVIPYLRRQFAAGKLT